MPCSQTLAGIPHDCNPSIGGIRRAWAANFADVKSVTVTDDIITEITMAGDTASPAKFKAYDLPKNVASFTSTLTADPAAGTNYVSTELVLQFNRMDTAKRVEMSSLTTADLAIIVEDRNGKYWYLGREEPATATAATGQTGASKDDGNFYQITITDEGSTFPFEVSADALKDIAD